MIKLSGLNKFFNKNRQNQIHVLNNVNLELPERGLVAVYGKSGCGKTTLLNVIGGLDGVESGSVLIDGADLSSNTDVLRNQYVGYIFQNYNLHKQETVFDNVAAALRLCGMEDPAEI
ncbi:MAG: ATP-binding cassette domain-containing protein, partial [Clostridiales bacterium]|nr:ATP-binding cassette domain-containing protein [Clostridiales bacterium]